MLFGFSALFPYPADKLSATSSRVFVDRNGIDLRVTASERGEHSVWCGVDSMGQWIGPAVIAVEDRRFAWHPGIDPIGITRAAWSNLAKGEIRSGGSTITQQLARLLKPELSSWTGSSGGSKWWRKLVEAWDAWRLERALGKKDILAQYLNRASFGNHAVGIAEASELYFGKKPEKLTASEAAYLAGLLQAPTRLSPYRRSGSTSLAMERRNTVLKRMRDIGTLDEESWRRAVNESIAIISSGPPASSRESGSASFALPAARGAPFHAPHFIVALEEQRLGALPDSSRIETTLDLRLQNEIEGLVARHIETLKNKRASQAAVVVLDARDGSILAWIGSRSFAVSQVDGVTALRQPGSTLKPFTYALAFESGKTPADLVADAPLDELSGPDDREPDHPAVHGEPSDGFAPANYDRTYHGLVRMREALACSYNIPAARVLRDIVGVERLLDFLKSAGMTCLDRPPTFYGIALTLGAGEVRLIDLAAAYAMLSRGGITVAPRAIADQAQPDGKRLLSPEAAALITSILSDKNARSPAFGSGGPLVFSFPVAAKTGTSKDFRDNWAVGYTPRHVVAVWVGNFDGAPMIDCSGVTGAGPLFHDIMVRVGADDGEFPMPPTLTRIDICPRSGAVAGARCPGRVSEFFPPGRQPEPICPIHSPRKTGRIEEPKTDGFRPL